MNLRRKHRGAFSELRAVTWLLEQGFDVFRNVSQHGPADLVATKPGEMLFIDVKTVAESNGPPRITDEQKEQNIKLLLVDENGACRLIAAPISQSEVTTAYCAGCLKPMQTIWKRKRVTCEECS